MSASSAGYPGIEPITTGSCLSSPSLKNPNTCEPSTSPIGVCPIPDIPADVTGNITCAQGKSFVGKSILLPV